MGDVNLNSPSRAAAGGDSGQKRCCLVLVPVVADDHRSLGCESEEHRLAETSCRADYNCCIGHALRSSCFLRIATQFGVDTPWEGSFGRSIRSGAVSEFHFWETRIG